MIHYTDLLKDPRWQRKRLSIFERDQWKCCRCGESNMELHVHHTYYAKGKKPWEYINDDIMTLCTACHTGIHYMEDALGIAFPICYIDVCEIYETLIVEHIEERGSKEKDPIFHCLRCNGDRIMVESSSAIFFKSEKKKGGKWFNWLSECRKKLPIHS